MNKLLFGVFLAVNLFTLLSCSKDKETLNANGYWFGMYGQGTGSQIIPYAILFREDGTMRVYSSFSDTATGNKAEGTYAVSGMTVTGHYTYFTGMTGSYSLRASDDDDDDELNGTYGSDNSQSGGGTFRLLKQ